VELAIALVIGLVGGLGVAVFEWAVTGPRRRLEEENLRLQGEQLRREIEKLTDAVRDTADSVRHRLPGADEYEFYRSGETAAPNEFVGQSDPSGLMSGAEGSWQFADGVLEVRRTNTDGEVWIRLNRYRHEKSFSTVINGRQDRPTTTLRVSCEARVTGGHHTILFVLKGPGDPGGVHLAPDQRIRLRDEEFLYYEKWFSYDAAKDAYLRIVARSPLPADAVVELRNIVVSDRAPLS
jgi:hypothetical protein